MGMEARRRAEDMDVDLVCICWPFPGEDPKGNPHPRAGTPCGSFGGDRGGWCVLVEEWACVAWEARCFCWTKQFSAHEDRQVKRWRRAVSD